MKRILAVATMVFLSLGAFSQALFNNNGADIHILNGALVVVRTNSVNNNTGTINNAGTFIIEGNVSNNAQMNGGGVSSGLYQVQQDWINNSVFNADQSTVELYGGSQQISGTAVTTFFNLDLTGGSSVKTQTVDAVVAGTLDLNDAELATQQFEMLVNNPAINAIQRNAGFVSSVNTGKLSRNTNLQSSYLFPTGSPSSLGASIYRPVEFAAATSAPNVYGSCLVKGDATTDGYNTSTTDEILCQVNTEFYHKLYHSSGSDAATLTMFYDPATDGSWDEIGHWESTSEWSYISAGSSATSGAFNTVSVGGINDFLPEPFALANRRLLVDAGSDVTLNIGESTTLQPVISGGVPTTINWTPTEYLNCSTCEQPESKPSEDILYFIEVTNQAGCVTSDSVLIKVNAGDLIMPTAFSPNGDGKNDAFRTLNKNLDKYLLQIWNRWGELVFETEKPADGWNGIFKGETQEIGVYVWSCTYKIKGNTKEKIQKGNLTLVR